MKFSNYLINYTIAGLLMINTSNVFGQTNTGMNSQTTMNTKDTIMKTKTIDSVDVIYTSEELTIPEIGKWGNIVSPLILDEVEKYGLEQSGPWIFISHGRDGKIKTKFHHEFCLPVKSTKNYNGSLKIKRLPMFHCAYLEYKGDMSEKMLGQKGYNSLVKSIVESEIQFTGESREVYTKWISPTSKDNEIEIQFGIK